MGGWEEERWMRGRWSAEGAVVAMIDGVGEYLNS